MNPRAIVYRTTAGVTVFFVACWAFCPLEQPDITPPRPPVQTTDPHDEPVTLAALDDSAFHAPLWFVPPPPPPPAQEAKTASLPPLKLQLLAIVRQGPDGAEGDYKALLYDSDTDKIIEVGPGQTLGDRTVVDITHHDLTMKDRSGTRILSLRNDASETRRGQGSGS